MGSHSAARARGHEPTAVDVVRAIYRTRRVAERRLVVGSIMEAAEMLARTFGGRARAARIARRWARDGADSRFGLVAQCLEHAAVA